MKPLTEPLAAMMQSNEQALIDYLEYRSLVEGEAARLAAIARHRRRDSTPCATA